MKHLKVLGVLAVMFFVAGNAVALDLPALTLTAAADSSEYAEIYGETTPYNGPYGTYPESSPLYPRVDWIVSNHALIGTDDANYNLVFETDSDLPDQATQVTAYDGSYFYYYYQVENMNSGRTLHSFNIDLQDSLVVVSAGYITLANGSGVSLDNDLHFNHNLIGEREPSGSSIVVPTGQEFNAGDSTDVDRQMQWDFGDINQQSTTTVIFLTCLAPAGYTNSGISNSATWNALVPAPTDPDFTVIPEPFSMVLLASAIFGLVAKKRNK